jgi:hypothetical protein
MESTWGQMISESRKWRLGLVFLFHDWEQIPRELAKLIKGAGCHYSIYTSSKETYLGLAEELAPFTTDEGLATPRHWAINAVRCEGVTHKFLAQMTPPPPFVVDRSVRTNECAMVFGRPVAEVEQDLFERQKVLFQGAKKKKK